MKKVLFLMISIMIVIAYGTYAKAFSDNEGKKTECSVDKIIDKEITQKEFNELSLKDTLISNPKNWIRIGNTSENEILAEPWFYIKEIDTNTVYIITRITDSTYRFMVQQK